MTTIQEDPYASIWLIRDKLAALGYKIEELELGGRLCMQFTHPGGQTWTVYSSQIAYPFPKLAAPGIGRSKLAANEFTARSGLPVPTSLAIAKDESIEPARQLLQDCRRVVVKPLDTSLGWGLTLDVTDEKALEAAIAKAWQFSDAAIVQQQVFGQEVRFALLGGKVRAALLRQTPRVIGDGRRTVSELIAAENAARTKLEMPYLTYPLLDESIIDMARLHDSSVPAQGQVIELGRGTMVKTGASIYNILDQIHPEYVTAVERAAALYGYGFFAIDMFMAEWEEAPKPDNFWFIELNSSPVLKLFYSCRDGKMFDILGELVPMIDRSIARARDQFEY